MRGRSLVRGRGLSRGRCLVRGCGLVRERVLGRGRGLVRCVVYVIRGDVTRGRCY